MARAPSRLGDRLGAGRASRSVSTVLLRRPLPPAARGTRRATPSRESQSVHPGNMATLRLWAGSREVGLDAPAMDRFPVGPGRWWRAGGVMSPLSTTCAVAACNDVDRRAVEFRLRPEDVCLDAVAARVSLQPFEAPARWTSSSTLRQEMHRRMLAGYSSLRSRQSYAGFEGTPGARMSRPAFAR